MNPFHYHRPKTLAEAQMLFRDAESPRFIAGGMTVLPSMKARLLDAENLIDLSKIEALQGIEARSGRLRIGASTTHATIANSAVVRQMLPALATLAGGIADRHVRNRGTLGGSLANNDPAADYPAAALALDAQIVTSERTIAAADFFTGLFETALTEAEIITAVDFSLPDRAAYTKHRHPASGYAIVGVFAARFGQHWQLTLTGSSAYGAIRLMAFEKQLVKGATPDGLDGVDIDDLPILEDPSFPIAYRRHLIKLMAKQAVAMTIDDVSI
ncbi:MAG: hypothetical protein BGP04_12515 [Rhizobiales bacterium 62-17]|nr:FAD binding domain-containing protein [Hyphomicrobiales bacterium]OJY02141.1 MAG: hypothetical protein BGP04_12515 [Rhizobiales bacterium 62-17]